MNVRTSDTRHRLAVGPMTSSYFLFHFILLNDRVLKYRFQRKKKECGDEWKENLKMFVFFSCILPSKLRISLETRLNYDEKIVPPPVSSPSLHVTRSGPGS